MRNREQIKSMALVPMALIMKTAGSKLSPSVSNLVPAYKTYGQKAISNSPASLKSFETSYTHKKSNNIYNECMCSFVFEKQ